MNHTTYPPHLLSIAGTDPSGGAGQMADVKTFSALGAYSTSVITAVLAQNTQGVQKIHALPGDMIKAQLESVFEDISIDAVKIGMIADRETALIVKQALDYYQPRFVVLDPVMVAKSGDMLVDQAGLEAVRDILVPLADVITPNLPEAAALLGTTPPHDKQAMAAMLPALKQLGPANILLKGGHLQGAESPDVMLVEGKIEWLSAPRVETPNLHGSGCTLASAIAALLPQRATTGEAMRDAKAFMTEALLASARLGVGKGKGPAHHFWSWW